MPIITNIDQIQKHVTVNNHVDLATVSPDIRFAEEQYIIPTLSKAQYDALMAKYQANSLTDTEKGLFELCEVALANFAYGIYITIGQVEISNQGVRIRTAADVKTAFQWQIHDIQNNYFFKKGFAYLDLVLEYLEENKASFAQWVASPAYTETKQFFINTTKDFDQHYDIHKSRRTFVALWQIMKKVEFEKIRLTLGDLLYNEMKAQILTGQLSNDNKELLPYIQPAIAHFSIHRALVELSVDVTPTGILINQFTLTEENRNSVASSDYLTTMKAQQAEADGNSYLNSLVTYLNENASDSKYPLYFASSLYRNPVSGGAVIKQNEKNSSYRAF